MRRAHITPYALSYTAWYIGLTILLALLFALLDWPGGMGTIVLIAFGASWATGRKFARRQGRAPSLIERRAYAWRALLGCFLATTALSFLVTLLAFPFEDLLAVFASLMQLEYVLTGLGVMLIASGLFYAAIRLGFVWAGERYAAED